MSKREGLSGLTSYRWSLSDCRALDGCLVKYLRALLRGKATDRSGAHVRSMSNLEVLKHWEMCPTPLELCIRRAKWLQDMVAEPTVHAQVIACIWGRLKCETFGTIDEDGRLTADAHSYAWQLHDDMGMLRATGVAEEFFEMWATTGDSWRALFLNEDVADAFSRIDTRAARAAFWLTGKDFAIGAIPDAPIAAPCHRRRNWKWLTSRSSSSSSQ